MVRKKKDIQTKTDHVQCKRFNGKVGWIKNSILILRCIFDYENTTSQCIKNHGCSVSKATRRC